MAAAGVTGGGVRTLPARGEEGVVCTSLTLSTHPLSHVDTNTIPGMYVCVYECSEKCNDFATTLNETVFQNFVKLELLVISVILALNTISYCPVLCI